MVLHGAGQHPGPGGVGVAAGPVQALHGQVVGFRTARGEDHLAGPCAEGLRERFAGLLDGTAGPAPGGMERGGIAGAGELGGHRLDRLRQHRSGRGVVEVSHGGLDSTSRMRAPVQPVHCRFAIARQSVRIRSVPRPYSVRTRSAFGLHPVRTRSAPGPHSVRIRSVPGRIRSDLARWRQERLALRS